MRFVVCRETDNPLLALFSDQRDKVLENYYRIRQETTLFDNLSSYFDTFLEFFGEVISDMYTLEDFRRDYPPRKLPEMPEDLKGELWGVVMERLLLERVEKQVNAKYDAKYEQLQEQSDSRYQKMQEQFDKIQAEEKRVQAELAKAQARVEAEQAEAKSAQAETERIRAQAESAQAEIKEHEVEVILDILSHRFSSSVPVDLWLPRLRHKSLEQLKILVSQALKVASVDEFNQLIDEVDTLSEPCS